MIFLDEKMSPMGGHSEASAYLDEQTKLYGLKESMFKRFAHDAGGMEICFESEVAWNQLTQSMAIAEFKSLQESQCLNEGFWETIKSWAAKVKAFFIKIWNAIKAWIKNLWQKLTGTTDKDLVKKVQEYASYGEKQDVELYGKNPLDFQKAAENAVKTAKEACEGAYARAQGLINTPITKDNEKFREELAKAEEDATDKLNDEYDKIADEDTESAELSANDIVTGLTNYEKNIKGLVKFLENQDKYVKLGMKEAEKAEKNAKKAEADKRKQAARPNSGVKTENAVTDAQKEVDKSVKITGICRKVVQNALKVANGVKSRLDHNHEVVRSAAKAFIKSGIKAKKERES